MIHCQWVNFHFENEVITQDRFEEMMNDHFQAMLLDETSFPRYIWTTNFVIVVTRRIKFLEEVEFIQIPRNPVCA